MPANAFFLLVWTYRIFLVMLAKKKRLIPRYSEVLHDLMTARKETLKA